MKNLFDEDVVVPVKKKKRVRIGDANSVFKSLGSSYHSPDARAEHDFYATDPLAGELLIQIEKLSINIWEPACGEGHLSKVFMNHGHNVKSTDLVNRGYGLPGVDFFKETELWDGDIITNPPYSCAKEFVRHALDIIPAGRKVCMFLKIQFMEGKGRRELFNEYPPHSIYVSSTRINCAKNGDFTTLRKNGGSPICYAWYVWIKGFQGNTTLKWIN